MDSTQHTTYDMAKAILEEGWASRKQIADRVGCTQKHITSLMSNMAHRHGIKIECRKHPTIPHRQQFRVCFDIKPVNKKTQPRSEHASYQLLIQEMNHIRLRSGELGLIEIKTIAEKAMLAAGVATED